MAQARKGGEEIRRLLHYQPRHYICLSKWRFYPREFNESNNSLKELRMFVTPAYAQGFGGGGSEMLMSIMPFILIFVVMYFLIIRPQRTQAKKRQEMLNNVRRGDQVITGGGISGKVTKVIDESEIEVEIAEGVRVKILRAMLAEVRVKGEPVKEPVQKK
tara:strand:+ start:28313 stop:28792 length:480 start_codon:yes stop_codon:yes gene_type:complete